VAVQVGKNRSNIDKLADHKQQVIAYTKSIMCGVNIVSEDAQVLRCPKLQDFYLGEYGRLEDSFVTDSTILSCKSERSAVLGFSHVTSSIIQWGSQVDSSSIVEHSFLCDCTHVERHGKVLSSFIGTSPVCAVFIIFNETLRRKM